MQQLLNQLLQFLQQGISSIFKFIELIWTWSTDQVMHVVQAPWSQWPLWKIALMLIVLGAVVWLLYKAALELWDAAVGTWAAFAALLAVFVQTLPTILLAGCIAAIGMFIVNTLDFNKIHLKWPWEDSDAKPKK